MNCKKCGNKIKFIESFLGLCKLCSDKEKKEQERLMVELEKFKQQVNEEKEKIRKAEKIITENTTIYDFSEDVKKGIKRKKYRFYKSNFYQKVDLIEFEKQDLEIINPFNNDEDFYPFEKEEIINFLMSNNFDLKKSINSLWEEHIKQCEEANVQEEIVKIKAREERRAIKDKAEKRVYGKVKTKRIPFTKEEKEMILSKFGNKCAVCNRNEGLHIHHKDKSPKNNQICNLIVLCGVCHKKIHMKVR